MQIIGQRRERFGDGYQGGVCVVARIVRRGRGREYVLADLAGSVRETMTRATWLALPRLGERAKWRISVHEAVGGFWDYAVVMVPGIAAPVVADGAIYAGMQWAPALTEHAFRAAARRAVHCALNDPIPVEIVPGDAAPVIEGQSWRYTTATGVEIRHPSAYRQRGWSSMCYVPSSRAVVVGADWRPVVES